VATYLDITEFTKSTIAGVQLQFRLTARLATGAVDPAYVGTVTFTSNDPLAVLPAPYTFVGADAGTKLFRARMKTNGARTVTANDGVTTKATARTQVLTRPPGWGFDDEGLLPFGDAASGIGAYVKSAHAISTREVEVEVSNLVQDNSPFLAGDALNPSTWVVQRLDNGVFLHVVSVTQSGTYKYTLLCLEEFGPVTVTHEASSSTLLDLSGNVINTPHFADFLGITDEDKNSIELLLAKRKVTSQDIANPQIPQDAFTAGTLQLDAAGDYRLESGPQLVKKLILRRLMSTPRDFFHLPDYGIGIRLKEPIPSSDLGRLKTSIEQQVLREPEVEAVNASIILAVNGVLTVTVRAKLRNTGENIEVGYIAGQQGVV
jgi:hypothetical protein